MATLEVDDYPETFAVCLEAPEGYHWEDGLHNIYLSAWFKGGWKRSEYWAMVLQYIEQGLMRVEPCSVATPCNEMMLQEDVICDYWTET